MFIDLEFGPIDEIATGRHWDRLVVRDRYLRRIAFYSAHGVATGDRILLHYGNTAEFFVDLAALWSLGACVIPIDSRLTPFEVGTLAGTAAARFSLWNTEPDPEIARALGALDTRLIDASEADSATPSAGAPAGRLVTLDADALILFTSGTTGDPKGVVHTHRSLRARWMALRHSLGLDAFRRSLCLLPTHFGHGLICNSLFPWLSGGHLFIAPAFKPDLILRLGALLDEHQITFMSSVPTVWRLALKTAAPPRSASLQRVFCGSAPLSAHLWSEIRRWTGAREVWNAYGITETGSWLAGTSVGEFVPEDGLIGEPWGGIVRIAQGADAESQLAPDRQCRTGETGHVWVNTPALMRGYLGRDDLTAAVVSGGWFCTGDIGVMDDRGWLHLRGRERDEINKGGMKVHPSDVDAVVERFEHTMDVCTFAIDDALLGEDVGVAVVLGRTDPTILAQLQAWMARHLARHQMPRKWYVLDEIPRTSRGKVNRAAVASRCAGLEPVDVRAPARPGG